MAGHQVWQFELGDHLILAPSYSNDIYLLNPTAASAWKLLRSGAQIDEAVSCFCEAFKGVPPDIVRRDIEKVWNGWRTTILAIPSHINFEAPKLDTELQASKSTVERTYLFNERLIRSVFCDESIVGEISPRISHLETASTGMFDGDLQITSDETGYQLFSDGKWVASEDHPSSIRVLFLQEFVRLANPGSRWVGCLHAAACGDNSKCVILAGETHTGKTTLAAVLMHLGLMIYSEDTVPIEASGFLIPSVPSALMVREPSWQLVSERFPELMSIPSQERYGQPVKFLLLVHPGKSTATPSQATAIVFSKWESGSAPISTVRLDLATAFARLIETGFWLAHDGTSIGKFCEWFQSLELYDMTYSDIDAAAEFVAYLLH